MNRAVPPITLQTRLFTLPKPGNTAEEYEDACAVDAPAGRFAVADGASASAFAGLWARLLVRHLVAGLPTLPDAAAWGAWLQPIQAAWSAAVQSRPLPWYVQTKVHQGAFATLLGLQLQPPPAPGRPGAWAALAVGDCCLFHVPGPDAAGAPHSFPDLAPTDFNQHPLAVSSNIEHNADAWAGLQTTSGAWQPGDTFIMATDAVALWIAQRILPNGAWARLFTLAAPADDSAFQQLVAEERAGATLPIDDLTLLLLQTGPPADAALAAPRAVAPGIEREQDDVADA